MIIGVTRTCLCVPVIWLEDFAVWFLGSALPLYTAMFVRPSILRPSQIRKKSLKSQRNLIECQLLYMCTHCLLPSCGDFLVLQDVLVNVWMFTCALYFFILWLIVDDAQGCLTCTWNSQSIRHSCKLMYMIPLAWISFYISFVGDFGYTFMLH
jgi:hypothetical protein